jgi:tetratricopeptide (TPR) repeat protein
MIAEYLAVETDKPKKDEAMLILGDIYRVAGDSENAIAEYKKVLEIDSKNLDAMAGLGLSMVNEGYIKEDKTMLQEGANILQQFASAAPDSHKYKDDAVGLIDTLRKTENIAPQKTPARKRN